MGRKKKKPVKPWCWYCNREFDDEKILIQHQRAKHFKCPFCHKKLYSGPGLTVHCVQVHKEHLDKIPEALPNKNSVDIDIYGMQGVPEDDLKEHERLKRGDTDNGGGNSSKVPDTNSNGQTRAQPSQAMQSNPAMGAMHAAMFQRASMGLAGMPPGFPPMMGPPPMMMAPPMAGMPPGFIPPPGFPPMGGIMQPGMPLMGFPPGMVPPMGSQMGFPMPPPNMTPLLPTTRGMVPPPPMSGVGHLIGVPPPNFGALGPPPPPPPPEEPQSHEDVSDRHHKSRNLNTTNDRDRTRGDEHRPSATNNSETTPTANQSTTISKPAIQVTTSPPLESKSFIDIPNSKSRIMHPNSELSLEELRLGLSKYRDLMERLSPPPPGSSSPLR